MNLLAIDTSNQVLGVAILKDEQIIGEVVTNIAKNHSVRLMPAIDQLMNEVSLTPEQLDKIVVAKGPGSYTGVRIGISTAKSLAWALDIPITGISSLEVLAYQGRFFEGIICPFFDARRGMVFTGFYEWQENDLVSVYEEKNISMEEVLAKLAEEKRRVLFLSPDISVYQDAIEAALGNLAIIPEGPYHIARPGFLGLAGLRKSAEPTHTLTPNYLRLAEAEANWLKAQKENEKNG
ncbi:tRNA (adenosine(37)-N6)-threonylcarbamoyltransferase complex dimerization subunit type 1 TsaB [Oceanobacillus chungangensis]|uniref:tRNA (Adenosine(37)-N6)-threonylcarbamoyltransferase complex dimerization subunit type 1 TsaB n=1 Tax=Oceanobacillus chungangensis TaxID=1229152 RepID=A0A3D8PRS9_9BACI|nr:tRNA (adenosine(37)-N6)-threonylcarbamoyltransferase complex dimerization subunit type 1 TsaB [Oceanobacillus chungangensis]RDW18823.1 tRNA (adenosine(37)-N6)-threonylcarbamoyltransferase complex dimerization subunit type 1 TsaB [Oceanobacillus chungangensis]